MKQFRAILLLLASFCIILAVSDAKAQLFGSQARSLFGSSVQPATCNEKQIYYNLTSKKTFICTAPNTWTELGGGGGAVSSVFTRIGAIVAAQGDYDSFFTTPAEAAAAAPVQSVFTRTGAIVAAQADYDSFFLTQAEGNALYAAIGGGGGVTSVFTRTGAVVAAQADYDSYFLTPAEADTTYITRNTTQDIWGTKKFEAPLLMADTRSMNFLYGNNDIEVQMIAAGGGSNEAVLVFRHGWTGTMEMRIVGTGEQNSTKWLSMKHDGTHATFSMVGGGLMKFLGGLVIEENGGRPTCSNTNKGQIWNDYGGVGGAQDLLAICATDFGGAQTWQRILVPYAADTISNTSIGARWNWSGAQYYATRRAATFATALTTDWDLGNVQSVTLTGDLGNQTWNNGRDGGRYVLIITQDATGGRIVSNVGWPASVKWSGGLVPLFTTTANKTDIVSCIYNGTNYFCGVNTNF